MPAEWEGHDATWICWPQNGEDWPGKLNTVQWVFAEMVKKLTLGETVRIIVGSVDKSKSVRRILAKSRVDLTRVEFFIIPTDRGWTRDMGPIFIKNAAGEKAIVNFKFNAWAKYPNWRLDNKVAGIVARKLKTPIVEAVVNGAPFTLEGGAIDVNGKGTLITTVECLLDDKVQTRNPGLGRKETEQALAGYLGAKNVIWLNKGIAGDDTHGHVDDLCRFVNANTVVLCAEDNPAEDNYRPLNENREILQGARLEDGSKPEVVLLPMPAPLVFDGLRLPASYANFYIGDAVVIVPTFNDVKDRVALGILSELFPGRQVIGIHAVDLVWGLGTLHCLTQQEPKGI
ncbi:MAG: agmatine deiminase family protein [Nitrospinae bacterium]|nr:agmatine deiminase family protein [Nitrospinota bacterium]